MPTPGPFALSRLRCRMVCFCICKGGRHTGVNVRRSMAAKCLILCLQPGYVSNQMWLLTSPAGISGLPRTAKECPTYEYQSLICIQLAKWPGLQDSRSDCCSTCCSAFGSEDDDRNRAQSFGDFAELECPGTKVQIHGANGRTFSQAASGKCPWQLRAKSPCLVERQS